MSNPLVLAGRLDRRVAILRDGTPTRNSRNEEIPVRWASVKPAPGTERFASAENAATAPMRFVFRWAADLVRVTDRLRHDGRDYDIKSVTEIGRREGWEVLATARAE
jgi:head-tail adaptor